MRKQKPLCIVESSSKCPKIEMFLNHRYDCIATGGHICSIENGLKSLNLTDVLKTKFKTKSCAKLRGAIKSHSEIILATDNDREGEAIAWHICRIFKLDETKTKRILFNEITKEAIVSAIENPTTIDMNMVRAQVTRQIVDILVGFKISPLLWKNIASNSSLSAGRCQTPTIMLLKEREDEINSTITEITFNTEGSFTSKNILFKLNKNLENELIDKFYELSKTHIYYLSLSQIVKSELQSPYPLVTSTLQQHSSNVLGYSPKKTMSVAQKLYQKGYITYMRTDSSTYSPEFKSACFSYISDTYGEKYIGNPRIKAVKNSQEAHEAIRPTNIYDEGEKIEPSDEKKLYREIRKVTLQSCMSKCIQNRYNCSIDAPFDTKYIKTFVKILFNGWKILNKEQINQYDYVLNLNKKKPTKCKYIQSNLEIKNKKTHFTESQLIKKIEEKGIGRPSTYSSLIEKIKEREYVEKRDVNGIFVEGFEYKLIENTIKKTCVKKTLGEEKNKLVITYLGNEVLEFLLKYFKDIFNYEFTATLETDLDLIAHNKKKSNEICELYLKDIKKCIPENIHEYEIEKDYIVKTGVYGPYIKHGDTNIKIKPGITINKIIEEKLTLDDVVYKETNIAQLTENISIRYGKYGWYIFYKKENMRKPEFYSLKKVTFDINNYDKNKLLDWINNTYNIYG